MSDIFYRKVGVPYGELFKNNNSHILGKKIETIDLDPIDPNILYLKLEGGPALSIYDAGQSCCEYRYMNIPNDIKELVGKTLRDITVNYVDDAGPDYEYTDDSHEIAFLEITTNEGYMVSISNHNEHNGYYGGFDLFIEELG